MKYKDCKISKFVIALALCFSITILGVVDLGVGSLLKYISIIPIIISLLAKGRIKIKGHKSLVLYFIFAIVSVFWTIDVVETQKASISFASFLLLFFCICKFQYNYGEISMLKQSLVWSSRISCIATWIFATYSGGRLFLIGSNIAEDPNYLCAYFYFGIAYCVDNFLSSEIIKTKLWSLIEFFLYIFTIFSTGSRGGLLGAIFVLLISYVYLRREVKIPFYVKISFVIFLLCGSVLASSFVDADVMDRYSASTIEESNGTGRYDIWGDAINAFCQFDIVSVFIGKGISSSMTVAEQFHFTKINVMHNVFLENLIGLGLIGAVLYLLYTIRLLKKSSNDIFAMSVFVGMIVLSLSTSIIFLKPSWNIQLFIACLSHMNFNSLEYEKTKEYTSSNA